MESLEKILGIDGEPEESGQAQARQAAAGALDMPVLSMIGDLCALASCIVSIGALPLALFGRAEDIG